jgi:hypothetical protein
LLLRLVRRVTFLAIKAIKELRISFTRHAGASRSRFIQFFEVILQLQRSSFLICVAGDKVRRYAERDAAINRAEIQDLTSSAGR